MKRLFVFAALLTVLASCSPSAYYLVLDSRRDSSSGIDLTGRSISIVYLESEDGRDSLYNNRLADALAYRLEDDLFDGEQSIGVYNLVKDPAGEYASRDTASQYVMLLDSDVVMILDTPEVGQASASGRLPVRTDLYIYDSLGGEADGLSRLNCTVSASSLDDSARAMNAGASLASPLVSQWTQEEYVVLYFDGFDTAWIDALDKADDLKWSEAIDIWLGLVDKSNPAMTSSARYNIALGCFMLEQYDLALEWLDSSDKILPLSISKSLRKQIQAKKSAI